MMEHHQKCKGVSAESSLLELCRATQHFDDGTSKCKICGVLAENDACDGGHQKKFFTPLQAHGMENFTAWRARKFSLATQKNTAVFDKQAHSNKILQNKRK